MDDDHRGDDGRHGRCRALDADGDERQAEDVLGELVQPERPLGQLLMVACHGPDANWARTRNGPGRVAGAVERNVRADVEQLMSHHAHAGHAAHPAAAAAHRPERSSPACRPRGTRW